MLISRNEPWLTTEAIDFLNSYLTKSMTALEIGTGASTVWLSKRVNAVYSIENNSAFAIEMINSLAGLGIDNVFYIYKHMPAVEAVKILPDEFFDFVLLDSAEVVGKFSEPRLHLARALLPKLRENGVVMLDNSERVNYREILSLFDGIGCRNETEQVKPDRCGFWYNGWKTSWWRKSNIK